MALPRGRASYKKKDGVLTLTDDRRALIWTPMPATGPPTVSLALDNIMNLQQTPDGAPKVILRVIEKPKPTAEPGAAPQQFLFQFLSPTDARAEANAIRDLLSQLLAAARENDPNVPKPVGNGAQAGANGAATSAAISFASTVNAKAGPAKWFDDNALKADVELQQSLMKKDEDLAQIYTAALVLKPASISEATFNAQFWSNRVDLLRSHAIELNQKKGAYNVLSIIKPRTEDGQFKLSLSSEQISMILQQHPLVRRIYNDNVPKLTESEFWSRFFLSKLFKKLRGERVTENDNSDIIFDRYLDADNTFGYTSKITSAQKVPHIIDLEANEENQGGFKSGNRKDVEMRPRSNIPIIKTLNSLSEKIMANVAPSDLDSTGPDGLVDDTRTFSELSLRDLQGDAAAERIMLNVKEQNKFFSNQSSTPSETQTYASQNPSEVLFEVQADLETFDDDGSGGIDLRRGIGVDDDSESDPTPSPTTTTPPKSPPRRLRSARKKAQDQILDGMRKKRAENTGTTLSSPIPPPQQTNPHFWAAFLSGDPARGQELAYYAETLRRSTERIEALAAEAEAVRQHVIEQRKREIKEIYERTRRKVRWQPPRGGKESVLALFEATLGVEAAQGMYEQAVKEGEGGLRRDGENERRNGVDEE
ncbi:RNA polymerase II transcription factor B subunit 1 [Collariella sp. IMI 366227]|nr:RNA polymerase II transcription factor B subunit 1 [Collariella sp. IMI 366227]